MKIIIVIPARYESSRFPGKPLAKILKIPMIIRVCDLCSNAIDIENIYVATDDSRIKHVVENAGYNVVMTDKNHLTGTDRIAEVSRNIDSDIFINVQGDEPILNPEDIQSVINEKIKYPNSVIKGYSRISQDEDPDDINIPKVIFTKDKKMIYMSRQKLPGSKDEKNTPNNYYKAVCIYAFNKEELAAYANFEGKGEYERFEDIEILRFMDLQIPVRLVETKTKSLAVDIPADIKKVEDYILKNSVIK